MSLDRSMAFRLLRRYALRFGSFPPTRLQSSFHNTKGSVPHKKNEPSRSVAHRLVPFLLFDPRTQIFAIILQQLFLITALFLNQQSFFDWHEFFLRYLRQHG